MRKALFLKLTLVVLVACSGVASAAIYPYDRLVWIRQLGTDLPPNVPGDDTLNGIFAFADGSSLLVGMRRAPFDASDLEDKEPPFYGPVDDFAVKFSAAGEVVWAKTIATRLQGERFDFWHNTSGSLVNFSSDGRFARCGTYWEHAVFGKGDPNETTLDTVVASYGYVALYNADGTLAWVRAIEDATPNVRFLHVCGVALAPDGTCYVMVYSDSAVAFGEGVTSDGIMLASYDAEGDFRWVRRLRKAPWATGDTHQLLAVSDGVIALTDRIERFTNEGVLVWTTEQNSYYTNDSICSIPETDDFMLVVSELTCNYTERKLERWSGTGSRIWTTDLPIYCVCCRGTTGIASAKWNGTGQAITQDGQGLSIFPYTTGGALGTISRVWTDSYGGEWSDIRALASEDAFLVAGTFSDTKTFGSGQPNETTLTSHGAYDLFVAKYRMEPLYYLDVDVVGHGYVTLNPPGHYYAAGTPVTLRAAPTWPDHDQFVEWQGDFPGTAPEFTITVTGDSHVTAVFEELPGAPPLPAASLAGIAILAGALAILGRARCR